MAKHFKILNSHELLDEANKITGQVRANIGANPAQLMKTIALAKSFGMELDQIASASKSLLNFESSIGAELEAELLLGRQINLERARLYALMFVGICACSKTTRRSAASWSVREGGAEADWRGDQSSISVLLSSHSGGAGETDRARGCRRWIGRHSVTILAIRPRFWVLYGFRWWEQLQGRYKWNCYVQCSRSEWRFQYRIRRHRQQ